MGPIFVAFGTKYHYLIVGTFVCSDCGDDWDRHAEHTKNTER